VTPRARRAARLRALKRALGTVLGLLLLAGALWILRREFGQHSPAEVGAALQALPRPRLALCLLATLLGYAALSAQDLLALESLGVRLPLGTAALAGFEGFAFANSLPFAVVVGGAVRARFYHGAKLSAADTTQLVLFNTATYALGLLGAAGLAFTFEPRAVPGLLHLPILSTRPLGLLALVLLALFLLWSAQGGPALRILKQRFRPTSLRMSLARLGVSLLDWGFSGLALFVLLPGSDAFGFPGFLGVFMLGQLAGLVAQLPGGIGVFEVVVVRMLSRTLPIPAIFGALLLYRVIYFLLPLALGAGILAVHELRRIRARR
jgi:glycosyltransferase 2 family protein